MRSHWKLEGWWAKRSRGHRALRIFCTPTHPGPNCSTHSPMTDRMLWVTARSVLALFSWYSRDEADFGCAQRMELMIPNHALFVTYGTIFTVHHFFRFTNSQCAIPAAYCVLWSFNNGRKWKRGSIIVKQRLTVIHLWHFTAESTIDYGRKQRQIHYAAHTHISRVLYISCSTLVIQNDQTHAEGLQPSVIISLNVSTDYGEMLLNNGRYGQSVSNILFGLNNSVSVNTDRLLMEHFSSALWRTIKNKKTHLITFRCHVLLHFNSLISIYKQYTDIY